MKDSSSIFPVQGSRAPRAGRGYTLVEILLTVLIISILGTVAMETVSHTDAGLRAERAARDVVAAVRFARTRAMSDGTTYKVRFNVGAKTISVIDPNNGNAVLAAPMAGAVMQINLSGQSDVNGVSMTPSLAGASADPYNVTYTALGGTANNGTVAFTYGGITKTLQIPNVGDPILVGDTRRP